MKCRKCGANPIEHNIVLTRVNEYVVKGVWECSPSCGVEFIDGMCALVYALDKSNKCEEVLTTGKILTASADNEEKDNEI